jgi:hypothetical protein
VTAHQLDDDIFSVHYYAPLELTSCFLTWITVQFVTITIDSNLYLAIKVLFFFDVQKVKTSVQKKNANPLWNEVLLLPVTNPTKPVKVVSLLIEILY